METYMQDLRPKLFFLSVALVLISCLSSTLYATPFEQQQKALNQIKSFKVTGKVGFKHANTGGSASIAWQQRGEYYAVLLYGPLSSESVTIQGGPKRITLIRPNHRTRAANTPETLLYQELGYEIPVSGLPYWLKGIPAPGAKGKFTLDERGRLLTLEQNGWVIHYLSYRDYRQSTGHILSLPHKIQLKRLAQHSKQGTTLKFVFQNWMF